MGAMTNNGRKLANFAGFYKGLQSAGAAIAYRIDALKVPYMNIFISNWVLLGASLILAGPFVLTKVKDTVSVEEDLQFSDETYEDVKPLADVEPGTSSGLEGMGKDDEKSAV